MRLQNRSLLLPALLIFLGCGQEEKAPALTITPAPEKIPLTTSSEEAKKLFEEGRDDVYSHNEAQAIEKLKAAIEKDPEFALAHLYLARAYDNINDLPEATRHLEKAKEIAKGETLSKGELNLIQAYDYSRLGEISLQKTLLSELVGLYPSDAYAVYELGRYYDDFGERTLKTAAAKYEEAIKLNENLAAAYNSVAYVYAELGDFEKAEARIKKYAELLPKNPNAFDSEGEILLWAGKYDASIEAYGKALALDDKFYYSYLGQGHAYSLKGEPAKAREVYAKSKDAALSNADKLQSDYWIAFSYLQEDKPEEALKSLRALLPTADGLQGIGWGARLRIDISWIEFYTNRFDAANTSVQDALRWLSSADLSEAERGNLTREALVLEGALALARKDPDYAQATLGKLQALSSGRRNPREEQYTFLLQSAIAVAQADYANALSYLSRAGENNPYTMDLKLRVYIGQSNAEAAEKMIAQIKAWNRYSQGYLLLLYRLRHLPQIPQSTPADTPASAPAAP